MVQAMKFELAQVKTDVAEIKVDLKDLKDALIEPTPVPKLRVR